MDMKLRAEPVKIPPFRGAVRGAWRSQAFLGALAKLGELWASPAMRIIHEGRNRLGVVPLPRAAGGTREVVVKEFRFRGLNLWKTLFGRSKTRRAWTGAAALVERGVPTPDPVAFLEFRRAGLVRCGYFLAEWVEGAREIRFLFRELKGGTLRALLERLVPFLRACHDAGVLHRDLSDGNILVREGGPGGFEFFLVDTNRIRVRTRIGTRRRVSNLIRLGVPPDSQRFFLDLYFGNARRARLWRPWYRLRKAAYSGAVALKKRLKLRKFARALRIQ